MSGFDDLDAGAPLAGLETVPVARHDEAADGSGPMRAERGSHGRGGLAGAEHERWPTRQRLQAPAASRRRAPQPATPSRTLVSARSARRQRATTPSPSGRSLLQRRDGRQLLALEELEERSAARRDVRDAVAEGELLDRRERVAAAGDRERLARRNGLRDAARAGRELGILEHAERAIPDDRAGARQPLRISGRRLGPDIEDHLVARDVTDLLDAALHAGIEARRHDDVRRQRNLGLAELAAQQSRGELEHVLLVQRLADAATRGGEDRVGDAAAQDQLVDLGRERLKHLDLRRDFRAAYDRGQRPFRVLERLPERLELRDEQRTGACDRRVARDAVRARLRAVRRAERIHDEHVAERGHALR